MYRTCYFRIFLILFLFKNKNNNMNGNTTNTKINGTSLTATGLAPLPDHFLVQDEELGGCLHEHFRRQAITRTQQPNGVRPPSFCSSERAPCTNMRAARSQCQVLQYSSICTHHHVLRYIERPSVHAACNAPGCRMAPRAVFCPPVVSPIVTAAPQV